MCRAPRVAVTAPVAFTRSVVTSRATRVVARSRRCTRSSRRPDAMPCTVDSRYRGDRVSIRVCAMDRWCGVGVADRYLCYLASSPACPLCLALVCLGLPGSGTVLAAFSEIGRVKHVRPRSVGAAVALDRRWCLGDRHTHESWQSLGKGSILTVHTWSQSTRPGSWERGNKP